MNFLLSAACICCSVFIVACAKQAEPGTPFAARLMAEKLVSAKFEGAKVYALDNPRIEGGIALVSVAGDNHECLLSMSLELGANEFGWVPRSISC